MKKRIYEAEPEVTPDGEIAYSVDQLAQKLHISKPVAYELIHEPGFPSLRIGDKKVIIPKRALLNWMDDRARFGCGVIS